MVVELRVENAPMLVGLWTFLAISITSTFLILSA